MGGREENYTVHTILCLLCLSAATGGSFTRVLGEGEGKKGGYRQNRTADRYLGTGYVPSHSLDQPLIRQRLTFHGTRIVWICRRRPPYVVDVVVGSLWQIPWHLTTIDSGQTVCTIWHRHYCAM